MKRYYFPNQKITTKDGYSLEITSGMTVYVRREGITEKLDSLYFQRTRMLAVCLPNGRTTRIYRKRDGLHENVKSTEESE